MTFSRITIEPGKMGGAPCIRGLRMPVATILNHLAAGATHEQILADFPSLEEEDIREALRFAAVAMEEHELPAVGS
jgi:uncharacterized protein (DUF433 family)